MNKKPLLAMSCAAVIAGALPLFAQTLDWTNAGGDRLWNNPLNWNPQAVPAITNAVTVGATATPTSPVLLAAAPGACNNLTLNGTGGGSLEVATNLTIGGTLLLANEKQGRFTQTGGSVTVTGALNMAYANYGEGVLSISGEDSVFHALGAISVARYYGAKATIWLDDGATALFDKEAKFEGENHATSPSIIDVSVRGESLLKYVGNLIFSTGCLSIISNAVMEVGGTWYVKNAARSTIQSGGSVVAATIKLGQYRDSNSLLIQEAGSLVVARSGLLISGCDQGGANSATNNVYDMWGGLLVVTNGMKVAVNGHGVFRQSGGVAEIRTGDVIVQTQTNTGSSLVLPVSSLELSGDAEFRQLGGTFYFGSQYNSLPAKVVIRGKTPQISVKTLSFRGGSLCPVVDADGVAPLSVNGNATFLVGGTVLPEALPNATTAPQTILTWTGTGTNPQNLALHPDVNPAQWKLVVDAANKKILLSYRHLGTVLIIQ